MMNKVTFSGFGGVVPIASPGLKHALGFFFGHTPHFFLMTDRIVFNDRTKLS